MIPTLSRSPTGQMCISFDAAWGGMGVAVADKDGPLWAGHIDLGGSKRGAIVLSGVLKRELYPMLEHLRELAAYAGLRGKDTMIRPVIETPGRFFSQTGIDQGNAVTLGRLVGMLELALTDHPTTLIPWLLTPEQWRKWWGISGGRAAAKASAMDMVLRKFGDSWLRLFPLGPEITRKSARRDWQKREYEAGARGDVAESILIGVGAASIIARMHPGSTTHPLLLSRGYKPKPGGDMWSPPKPPIRSLRRPVIGSYNDPVLVRRSS